MNAKSHPEVLSSAGFTIYPSLGQLKAGSKTAALGPINMKVLMVLLRNPGQVISRSDFYQQVWGEQLVSDDALTRCISDLRFELGNLSGNNKLIETLPKRGYRWIPTVEEAAVVEEPESRQSVWMQYIGFSALSLVIIGILSSATLAYFLKPPDIETIHVALVPIDISDSAHREFAVELEDSLKYHLLATPNLRFVSRGALGLAAGNYSSYARDLNVKWIIESDIRDNGNSVRVSLSLVDPYTSLVVHTDYVDIASHPSELNNFSIKFASDVSRMLRDSP